MVSVGESGAAYMLPHLLNRDAGNAPFKEMMIIGAGSGNDVSAALKSDVGHVDAVEIEPVLNETGRRDHPNQPYSDPRVSIHLDDGRSFVRRSGQTYDMIAYALVDSLVLHSGYSSLRLESFLFTEQAFHDIKDHLGDDGVFVMYNYFRQGWIVGRLVEMARTVFGAEPIVISLPYMPTIKASDSLVSGQFTFVIVGKPNSKALESIRKKLQEDKFFWVSQRPSDKDSINGYGPDTARGGRGANRELAEDRPRRSGHERHRPATHGRLAVPVPARGVHPGAELARDGRDGRPVDGDFVCVCAGPGGPPQRSDVLPGRGLHAAGDQGRRPHGLAVRVHLGGQLDRVLRDPGDDPLEQHLRAGAETTGPLAPLPVPDPRGWWSTPWSR